MAKISVIGICGNSIFMRVDHFHQKGETLGALSVYEEIGGKGINQAVAASKMGAEVSFLAAVGDDSDAEKCRKTAEEYNIKGYFAEKKGVKTTFAVILTDKNGENQVTGYRSSELEVSDVASFEKEIAESDILLLQNEVPVEVNAAAIKIAEKYGTRVILNPAPIREIDNDIAKKLFAVTPNEQEKQAIESGRFKNVITTLGSKGCSINDEFFIDAINVKPVDTTGAGDTFNGTLAVLIAEGKTLKEACKYAVAASGMSVSKSGVLNAIPTREEIERMMKNE